MIAKAKHTTARKRCSVWIPKATSPIYTYAVVTKNADGSSTLKESADAGPLGVLGGTPVGSLICLLGGPVELAGGATPDPRSARIREDFVDDVVKVFLRHRVALAAEVEEDWTTPLDTLMESIGGIVFRRALTDVTHSIHDENVAAIKADLAQLKAELAEADAERNVKLREKMNHLDYKLQAQLQKAIDRRQAAEREAQAKITLLKAKAAAARERASTLGR